MKKSVIASVLLCFLLCSSCADGDTAVAETKESVGTHTAETEEAVTEDAYIDHLPADLDFGGYEVRILGGGSLGIDTFDVDADDTADIVKDAVYRRNRAVEERLNVTITPLTYEGDGWNVFSKGNL